MHLTNDGFGTNSIRIPPTSINACECSLARWFVSIGLLLIQIGLFPTFLNENSPFHRNLKYACTLEIFAALPSLLKSTSTALSVVLLPTVDSLFVNVNIVFCPIIFAIMPLLVIARDATVVKSFSNFAIL